MHRQVCVVFAAGLEPDTVCRACPDSSGFMQTVTQQEPRIGLKSLKPESLKARAASLFSHSVAANVSPIIATGSVCVWVCLLSGCRKPRRVWESSGCGSQLNKRRCYLHANSRHTSPCMFDSCSPRRTSCTCTQLCDVCEAAERSCLLLFVLRTLTKYILLIYVCGMLSCVVLCTHDTQLHALSQSSPLDAADTCK